ncbi:hypothetical protein FRX31_023891 [Thalictrum thalictroides]|uniref:Uncharacterized protein n=1 Tax=Thalictrum thalictroides TaxID=46969 RepID=A0A7J6VNQ6_THATH|nr:hypothetical protein FRX31_023891 [Thalictrum thalictroides]
MAAICLRVVVSRISVVVKGNLAWPVEFGSRPGLLPIQLVFPASNGNAAGQYNSIRCLPFGTCIDGCGSGIFWSCSMCFVVLYHRFDKYLALPTNLNPFL